ncbi:hypothetical protein Asp14428_62580 [Actinoplanes sp. NBRC 14428]|uniref:Ferritin-like protein n=1 Tax=Pseudosporangium ferrugineum TaxID=439699 RepID=A0A2T0RDX9_9ACTN|nr:hypothetical protein [Pseudosporangium ferrugineum]PRY19368.1 hypothetical protein CLV70_13420 [Pseudosporangium ferrugineum]BCJ54783.1 hypothetical protein Asp14428_62580 [Actinoplanes sp. NBRC 14428]
MKRRQLLGTAAGVSALAGCGLFDDDPEPPPAPDALQPLLDEAVALAAAYDRAAVAEPRLAARLTPLADDHRAHAAELAKVIGAALPSTAPSAPPGPAYSLKSLRKAEQVAQKTAAAACRKAPAARAALTGSIAAARAAHAEVLR